MLGQKSGTYKTEIAKLSCNVDKNDNRQDYLRAKITAKTSGVIIVTPFKKQDSSKLANYADAHCLILRQPFANALSKGENVRIIRLD
jgi:molybdopterin molybdotransferase